MGCYVEEGKGRSHLIYPPGLLKRAMSELVGKMVLTEDGKKVGEVLSIVFCDHGGAVASLRITDNTLLRRFASESRQ